MERNFYIVDKDSPVMAVIREASLRQRRFLAAADAYRAAVGASGVKVMIGMVVGLMFAGDPPRGWRKSKGDWYIPDLSTKEGISARANLASLPIGLSDSAFSNMLTREIGGTYGAVLSERVHYTVYSKHGDNYILSVPSSCTVTPPGCRILSESEYQALRDLPVSEEIVSERCRVKSMNG